MKKTHYSTLEIGENATQEEIKHAFRTLAKKYHPDNPKTGDIKKYREIAFSYKILSDLEEKKIYDEKLIENRKNYIYSRTSCDFTTNDNENFIQKILRKSFSKKYIRINK